MVNITKRQFLKALALLLLGHFALRLLPSSTASPHVSHVRVDGDGSTKVRVEDGALVVE